MTEYEEIDKLIEGYNWDDGFSLPQRILENQNCDLTLALKIFYLGDGYDYLQIMGHVDPSDDWLQFVGRLYSEIIENKYKCIPLHHYSIPLTKVQKYKLKKQGIPSILWMDI